MKKPFLSHPPATDPHEEGSGRSWSVHIIAVTVRAPISIPLTGICQISDPDECFQLDGIPPEFIGSGKPYMMLQETRYIGKPVLNNPLAPRQVQHFH